LKDTISKVEIVIFESWEQCYI